MPPLPLITAQTEEKLLAFLTEHGHTKFRTQQVLDWVWRKRVTTFDAMSNLPPALKNLLAENFRFHTPEIVEIHGSADTTRKFLTKMEDGSLVESVIIPAAAAENGEKSERVTLCVSSQVGCAFGCKFCASGLLGLKRHLSTGEIIGQILSAEAIAGKRVNNIVFMGMGEPLSNFDNLADALEIITSHRGLEIGARHITISTSGFVPGLKNWRPIPGKSVWPFPCTELRTKFATKSCRSTKNGRSPSSFRPLRNGTGEETRCPRWNTFSSGTSTILQKTRPISSGSPNACTPKSISSRTTPWRGSRGNALRKNAAVPSGMQFTRRASPLPCGMKKAMTSTPPAAS